MAGFDFFSSIRDLFSGGSTYWSQNGVNYLNQDGQGNDIRPDPSFGSVLNNITGQTAQNEYNSAEAQRQRSFTTSERLAAQEYNSAEAEKARQWESAEAAASRAWQMDFDNSAVSRRMADLQAAGVNPMLAVGSSISAGSASGATASGGSAASISPGSGTSAVASGNSASAVASMIRSLTNLVKVAK